MVNGAYSLLLAFFPRMPGPDSASNEKKNQPERNKKMTDLLDKIMDYEEGNMDEDQIIEFFQELIDSGLAWTLQGSYGRMAKALIDNGLCHK